MKLLLENGAEVKAEGGHFGNALQAASFRGNETIVKLLLENGGRGRTIFESTPGSIIHQQTWAQL